MSISLFFPLWAQGVAEAAMRNHGINHVQNSQNETCLEYKLPGMVNKDMTAQSGIEKTLIYLHLPYDKHVSELNLLQQIRFMGKNRDCHTRYVQVDDEGKPLTMPNRKFVKHYAGFVKSNKYQKVGAAFDVAVSDVEQEKALMGIVAGAIHSKSESLIAAMSELARASNLLTDPKLQDQALLVAKAMLVQRQYREWFAGFSASPA